MRGMRSFRDRPRARRGTSQEGMMRISWREEWRARERRTAATPLKEFGEDPAAKTNVVAKSGQFGLYVSDGAINATVPKDEPLDELTPERAFELLAIRREKLGLEPGQPAPKASKAGRRSSAPARTVKKGATRKKAE